MDLPNFFLFLELRSTATLLVDERMEVKAVEKWRQWGSAGSGEKVVVGKWRQ